jgi:hypothetical protein
MEVLRSKRPSRMEQLVPDTPQGKQLVGSRKAQLSQKLITQLQQSSGDLNDDFSKVALAPALSTAIERHCEAELGVEVRKWKGSSKKNIDTFWKKEYTKYLDSMEEVLAMRAKIGDMEDTLRDFHVRLFDRGQVVLHDYEAFLQHRKMVGHIGACSNVVTRCQALVALAERAKDLLDAKSYTLALKTVQTLKEDLDSASTNSSVTPFVVEKLKAWIPNVERKVRSEAVEGFETWLTEIDGEATSTAERLMNRCREWLEQQDKKARGKTADVSLKRQRKQSMSGGAQKGLSRRNSSAQRGLSRRGSVAGKGGAGDKAALWELSNLRSNTDNESDLKKLKLHCPPVYVLLYIFESIDQLEACRQIYKERRFPVVKEILQQLTQCSNAEQLLRILPSKLHALIG